MSTLVRLKERNAKPPRTICGARFKRKGGVHGICQKTAGDGTNHAGFGLCARHGGNSPEAQRVATLQEAMYLGKTYGSSIKTDPAQALVDELARTNGAVQWLQLQIEDTVRAVEAAGEDPLTFLTSTKGQLIRNLYDKERDRLTRISAACLNLGLKERELRLAEQMGWLIQRVLEQTLNDLNLTPAQRDSARPILAAHLKSAAHQVVEGQIVSR